MRRPIRATPGARDRELPHHLGDGVAFPDELYTNAGNTSGAANWSLMVRHLHDIGGGAILTAPGIADLENEQIGHLARKYMGTTQAVDGIYETQLFHAVRDLTADCTAAGMRSPTSRRVAVCMQSGSCRDCTTT